jgi:hypothetical protein
MIEYINESIERTARLTGLSPETVPSFRPKIPLYAGSGLAMSSLARQDNYEQ